MKLKVLDSIWFNTLRGSFGIVLAENLTTGERKIYAGIVDGLDEETDERALLDWGSKVNLDMLGNILAKARGKESGSAEV